MLLVGDALPMHSYYADVFCRFAFINGTTRPHSIVGCIPLHEVAGQAELAKGRDYPFLAACTPAFTAALTIALTAALTTACTTAITAAFTAAYWQERQTHTKHIPKSEPTHIRLVVDNNGHSVLLHQLLDTMPTQMQERCGNLLETRYG